MFLKHLIVLVLAGLSLGSEAQTKDTLVSTRSKPAFSSINQVGIIIGAQEDPGLSLQSINGLLYKDWFAGIGAGFDSYEHKTLPLFIDVHKGINNSKTQLFLFCNGGFNVPAKRNTKDQFYYHKYKGGLYAGFGAGYAFKISSCTKLLVSAGYTIKKMSIDRTYYYSQNGEEIFERPEHYQYNYRRLLLQLGFQF